MSRDPILDCLVWLANYFERAVSPEVILSGLPLEDGLIPGHLIERAAENAGLLTYERSINLCEQELPLSSFPCLGWWQDSPVIITAVDEGRISLLNPSEHLKPLSLLTEEFQENTRNVLMLFSPASVKDDREPELEPALHEHWLWGALLAGRGIYREVLLVSLLVNLFALSVPLFVRLVYDRVIPGMAMGTLNALTVGILLVIVFEFTCRYLRNRFIDLAAKKSDLLISSRIYAKVMAMQLSARPASTGAFARQLQDFDAIREFLTSTCLTALVDIPFALIFLLVIGLLAGKLVWIPILAIALMIIVSLVIQPALRRTIEESERLSARKQGDLVESLTGMETLRLAGAQWRFQKRWEQAVGQMATWGLKTRTITGTVTVTALCAQQLTTVAVIFYGVMAISNGGINLGALIAIMMLTGRAMAPFMQLALLATRYHQARTAYKVTGQLMFQPDEQQSSHRYRSLDQIEGKVDCEQVSFKYPGASVPALVDLTLKIPPGEKVAIVGRSGSGKSTLARVLAALYAPDQGRITFDDIDINDIHPRRLRMKVGFLAQEPWLFHGTVKDNIILGHTEVNDEALLYAAQASGVTGFTGRSLAALEYPVGEGGQRLSGGQRKAVALARVLLNKPDVLVLDEPTAHMDSLMEDQVRQTLAVLPATTTLILMTHRSSLLDAVSRVVLLDGGRVISDKSREDIRAEPS
ncbi:MAG: type I secretion system permease/ATPase [Endozoicomonas sp.]|uniref:type I secretion system permease/ATPase n=1 Tax=Endozoicomonas sp. TaxID=1892382 RepID=UPI003D9BB203